MTKYILLNNDDKNIENYYDYLGNKLLNIGPLKKLNLLVGTNNSGKSRFIRNLIKKTSKAVLYVSSEQDEGKYEFKRKVDYIINSFCKEKFDSIDSPNSIKFKEKLESEKYIDKLMKILNLLEPFEESFKENLLNEAVITLDSNISKELLTKDDFYYIPILRGIENFEKYFKLDSISNIQMTISDFNKLNDYTDLAKKIYTLKTVTEYGISRNSVFTGEDFHNYVVDILLGDEDGRNKFHEFEKFIDDNFYDGEGFSINANKEKRCLMVKVKNDKEHEIYHLGDGIKQLIVILYQIFLHKDEEYTFYIEEPEINLHPGFQRKLMELLMSDMFKKHTYFINTHSNHIIDIINDYDDVALFKFTKGEKLIISKITNNNVSLLNELGIRSSSIFLSNCTIWVEGISDRIYLKKYLDLYFKHQQIENLYKENIHYSFVEYQGNNITHWNFDVENDSEEQINIKWLSHNAFLIVDNDNAASNPSGKKNLRHNSLEKILNDNFYKLKYREMENLISLDILEKMLKTDNNLHELTFKRYNSPQTKHLYEQKRISNPNAYLGEFIEDTYSGIKRYRTDKSKTVKNKAEFAKKICDEINDWDDLTEEAKNLTVSVFNFIKRNNIK